MMQYVVNFGRFWYDFVIGDDWRVAAAVVAALIVTALLVHGGIAAWWVLPLAVTAFLAISLHAAARPA
jgi:hypothetical protein